MIANLLGSERNGSINQLRLLDHGLLRQLRRPVRLFNRLLEGTVLVPRSLSASIHGAVIGGAMLYGAIIGGQFSQGIDMVASSLGFSVSEIEISGNTYTQAGEIYQALGLGAQRSLMSIDVAEAKLSLTKMPWVESARISKIYPSKLEIEIEERAAFALWQQGEAVTVIQADGKVIGGYAADARLAALPLLVGKGAEEEGRVFIDQVARYQDVAARVKAYIRVGTRRWDLRLDNGMTIRLPASGLDHALGRLTAMQAELGVFERDLAAIDLRVSDRTVFALTENAAIKRKDFVSSRRDAATKVRKARGSRI